MVLVTSHSQKDWPCSMLSSIFLSFFFHFISQPYIQILHHFCGAWRQWLLVRRCQERGFPGPGSKMPGTHLISGHACLFWSLYASTSRASHPAKEKNQNPMDFASHSLGSWWYSGAQTEEAKKCFFHLLGHIRSVSKQKVSSGFKESILLWGGGLFSYGTTASLHSWWLETSRQLLCGAMSTWGSFRDSQKEHSLWLSDINQG